MATMTFHTAMNMNTAVQWFKLFDEASSSLTKFVIFDGFHSAAFFGYGFTYDAVNDGTIIKSGTVTGYRGYENGELVAQYDGLQVHITELSGNEEPLRGFFQAALRGSDTITGSDQADVLLGFMGKDILFGGVGADRLYGEDGRDTIYGNNGRDLISGGKGDDLLHGDGKNDTLVGDSGADKLTGGRQSDHFVFRSANDSRAGRQDTVTDFSSDQRDRIDLSAIDASTAIDEDQAFRFIGDDAFSGAGQARFEDGLLEGDIDGDGTADFVIAVDVEALSKSDLIL